MENSNNQIIGKTAEDDLEVISDDDSDSDIDFNIECLGITSLQGTGEYLFNSNAISSYRDNLQRFIEPAHKGTLESAGPLASSVTNADPEPSASHDKRREIEDSAIFEFRDQISSRKNESSSDSDYEGQTKAIPVEVAPFEHSSDSTPNPGSESLQQSSPSHDEPLDGSIDIVPMSTQLTKWITDRLWPPSNGLQRIWYLCVSFGLVGFFPKGNSDAYSCFLCCVGLWSTYVY